MTTGKGADNWWRTDAGPGSQVKNSSTKKPVQTKNPDPKEVIEKLKNTPDVEINPDKYKGKWFYTQIVSAIEKGKLLAAASTNVPSAPGASPVTNDTKLLKILQGLYKAQKELASDTIINEMRDEESVQKSQSTTQRFVLRDGSLRGHEDTLSPRCAEGTSAPNRVYIIPNVFISVKPVENGARSRKRPDAAKGPPELTSKASFTHNGLSTVSDTSVQKSSGA